MNNCVYILRRLKLTRNVINATEITKITSTMQKYKQQFFLLSVLCRKLLIIQLILLLIVILSLFL